MKDYYQQLLEATTEQIKRNRKGNMMRHVVSDVDILIERARNLSEILKNMAITAAAKRSNSQPWIDPQDHPCD